MKKNYNGYIMVEVVAAFSVFLTIMITLIPIIYQMKLDEHNLHIKRIVETTLHDKLQSYLWTSGVNELPVTYDLQIKQQPVSFSFSRHEHLIKGCAIWDNVRQTQETFCLYGYPA